MHSFSNNHAYAYTHYLACDGCRSMIVSMFISQGLL